LTAKTITLTGKTGNLSQLNSGVTPLLKWMLEGPRSVVPSVKEGRVTYPDVGKLIPTGNPTEVLAFLLARGLLIREYYESEILCPACGSSSLKDRYTCASCHGRRIETGEMIEHYSCGNVDFEVKFIKEEELRCPKCRKELKIIGTDYRRIEKLFRCNDCGKASSIPGIAHVCHNCGTVTTPEKMRLRILYEYRINEQKRKEVESMAGMYEPLVEFFEKKGYKTTCPTFLKGESGIKHQFDLVAEIDGKRMLLDIAIDEESVTETEVMIFFAKTMDVAHEEAVLVAVPRMSEYGRSLIKTYNIDLVEGDSIDEILVSIAARYLDKPAAPPSWAGERALVSQADVGNRMQATTVGVTDANGK